MSGGQHRAEGHPAGDRGGVVWISTNSVHQGVSGPNPLAQLPLLTWKQALQTLRMENFSRLQLFEIHPPP